MLVRGPEKPLKTYEERPRLRVLATNRLQEISQVSNKRFAAVSCNGCALDEAAATGRGHLTWGYVLLAARFARFELPSLYHILRCLCAKYDILFTHGDIGTYSA